MVAERAAARATAPERRHLRSVTVGTGQDATRSRRLRRTSRRSHSTRSGLPTAGEDRVHSVSERVYTIHATRTGVSRAPAVPGVLRCLRTVSRPVAGWTPLRSDNTELRFDPGRQTASTSPTASSPGPSTAPAAVMDRAMAGTLRRSVPPNGATEPDWSPDGHADRVSVQRRLAAARQRFTAGRRWRHDIQQVTFDAPCKPNLDWQPLPVNTPSTYARPKSATKIHAALVPAHAACTYAQPRTRRRLQLRVLRTPIHLSSTLTVGVGDGSRPSRVRSARSS